MKNNSNKLAFSLIEITVVLVILSIVLSVAIVGTSKVLEFKREQRAEKHIDEVREKIERYRVANGRYPCPAPLNLAVSDANFGIEAARSVGGTSGIACYRDTSATSFTYPNPIKSAPGTFRVTSSTGTDKEKWDASILIGTIPVQALGLDRKYATDAWGNKIIYAVTEKLAVDANNRTTDTGDNLVTTAKPDNTNGNIRVEDALTATAIATAANYVVVAPGQDGNGAFNANSTVQSACEADAGDTGFLENNNCDFTNNIFVTSSAMNKVEGANYFYDIVRWDSFSSSDVQISGSASVNNGLSIQGNSLAGASALNVASGGASITGNSAFQGGTTTVANSLVSSGGATFSGGTGATFSAGAGTTTRINNALNSSGGAEFSGGTGTLINNSLNSNQGAIFQGGTGTEIRNPLVSTNGATFSGDGTATNIDNDLTVSKNAFFTGDKTDIDNADIKLVDRSKSVACSSSAHLGRLRFNDVSQHTETCIQSGVGYIWKPVQDGLPCLPSDPACKGPSGEKGDKGDPCPPSDPACKGPQGPAGLAGSSGKKAAALQGMSGPNHKCSFVQKKFADSYRRHSYWYTEVYSANPFEDDEMCSMLYGVLDPGPPLKCYSHYDYYCPEVPIDGAKYQDKVWVKCNDALVKYCYYNFN